MFSCCDMLNTVLYAVMNSICCEFLCGWLCFASHCQTSAPNRVALRLYRSSPEPLALRCTTSAPSCLALRCSPPGTQHPIGRQSERGRPQRQGVWHGDAAPPPTRATYHLSGGGVRQSNGAGMAHLSANASGAKVAHVSRHRYTKRNGR